MQDDFDSILDSCLADLASGRATVEACLRRYPAHAGQLAALLAMAEQVKTLPPPARLPDDKRRMLESRLLRQAGQIQPRPVSRPVAAPQSVAARRSIAARPRFWRREFAWIGAAAIAVLLLVTTAVSASAASVPGELLYPVKRAAEQVRLSLASPAGQVDLHLEFARQRLQELQVVENRGVVSDQLLAEVSAETAQVLDKIPALPKDSQRAHLQSLTAFEDQHLKALEAIAAAAHGDEQSRVMAALANVTALRQQVEGLLAGTASDSSPVINSAGTPQPTILEEPQPSQAGATEVPSLSDTAQPQNDNVATDSAQPQHGNATTDTPGSPEPEPDHTPPGQMNKATPHVPPGQAKPDPSHQQSPKPTKPPK